MILQLGHASLEGKNRSFLGVKLTVTGIGFLKAGICSIQATSSLEKRAPPK